MPERPSNIEDITSRLKDMKAPNLGKLLKDGLGGRRKWLLAALVLVILFFAVITPFAMFYTDALWFNHIGFQSLFWKTLIAKILMVVGFGGVFFAVLYGNLVLARKIPGTQRIDIEGSPLEEFIKKARTGWKKLVGVGLLLISLVAAFSAGMGWAGKWDVVLKFLNSTTFGKTDPAFGKDIGFYVFSYPFQRALADWLLGLLIFVFVAVVVVYILDGGIRLAWGADMFAPYVKAHLSILLAVIFLVKAWSYRLNMYELLFSKRGVVFGIGYTDANVRVPALWLMLGLAVAAAVILVINIWRKGWLLPAIAVGSIVVVAVLAGTVAPLVVQNLVVKPSERAREQQYIKRSIDATRDAYDIEKVKGQDYPALPTLDMAAIEENDATIKNIRLWDPRTILDTFQQLQAIRTYYRFNDADVDRYYIDGRYRQTLIGAREMNQANLPADARTWVNDTLVYTHGFGSVLSPTHDTTSEGNPEFIVGDIPPVTVAGPEITEPRIYFGETQKEQVVVDTTEKEFDFPVEGGEERNVYSGTGGVRVNSLFRRLLFSIRFADVNMFLSSQIRDDSRVLYIRDVSGRLSKSAPFLRQDGDPYLVIDDAGKLFWITDCYTTTDKYPYSEPTEQLGSYIRNSVKAVIDAFNGDVKLYVIDPDDPVIATYRKIFPDIFEPFEAMPPDLVAHIRYPEGMFTAQANILRSFHMTNPDQFYNQEDLWDFPTEVFNGEQATMEPYYAILRIPGEEREEMVLMTPFTPHRKQNMIAWLGARMDPPHYGELINFTFPRGRLIYGPEQVEGRIEQDPEISRQLSLWRQAGSEVIRGNLLVIPIDGSLLYVEPLFLQATQIKIPQIKRVVVVYDQQVVMAPTLEQALLRMFTGAPPTPLEGVPPETEPGQPSEENLGRQALDLYNKAVDAQKAGDWAAYGSYLDQLEKLLDQIAAE